MTPDSTEQITKQATEVATLGGGCFWCLEAVFQMVEGVERVVSGYAGGRDSSPTYEAVCSGTTGHAEVIQITFNNEVISYPELLELFFHSHDPTTLNSQGNDVGTQYRSVIFFHSESQKAAANEIISQLDTTGGYSSKIVTQVAAIERFYPAESYHQNYYLENPQNRYCALVIAPKIEKMRKLIAT